jgi:hypothetical protein
MTGIWQSMRDQVEVGIGGGREHAFMAVSMPW